MMTIFSALAAICCIETSDLLAAPSPIRPEDPPARYQAVRLKKSITIDANWDKDAWKGSEILRVERPMGDIPKFTPKVEARMAYDSDNAYVIFRVQDRYVRSVVQEYNGNVSGDSCVEFFFAPDPAKPLQPPAAPAGGGGLGSALSPDPVGLRRLLGEFRKRVAAWQQPEKPAGPRCIQRTPSIGIALP